MAKDIVLSIDAMGGANAPGSVIEGLNIFCQKHEEESVFFHIYGDQTKLRQILSQYHQLNNRYKLIHTPVAISDTEQPVRALKQGKESSMRKAIDAVKEGEAQACVSSGNTGALMVMAKMVLGVLSGISRPAIISLFPSFNNGAAKGVVILDLGANAECDSHNLLQFALMGHCFAKVLLGKHNPSIGILNVGTEEYKGRDIEKKSYDLLKSSKLNFVGFVEGHDLIEGAVDVVVTDGFSGNLVIKVAEGTAKVIKEFIKRAFKKNFFTMIIAYFTQGILREALTQIDPRRYNGAMFVGVNGIVVKSHGSSDGYAFANAVEVAINLVKQEINSDIVKVLKQMQDLETSGSFVKKIKQKLGF